MSYQLLKMELNLNTLFLTVSVGRVKSPLSWSQESQTSLPLRILKVLANPFIFLFYSIYLLPTQETTLLKRVVK